MLCSKLRQEPEKITKIYSSTYLRATQTIEPFAKESGLEIVQNSGFDAFNVGEFFNRSYEGTIKEIGKDIWQQITTNPSPSRRYFEGGETLKEQSDRAWQSLREAIAESLQQDVIAIVTHETVINCLLCQITKMPLNKIWFWGGSLQSVYPSTAVLVLWENKWFLQYYESA